MCTNAVRVRERSGICKLTENTVIQGIDSLDAFEEMGLTLEGLGSINSVEFYHYPRGEFIF